MLLSEFSETILEVQDFLLDLCGEARAACDFGLKRLFTCYKTVEEIGEVFGSGIVVSPWRGCDLED